MFITVWASIVVFSMLVAMAVLAAVGVAIVRLANLGPCPRCGECDTWRTAFPNNWSRWACIKCGIETNAAGVPQPAWAWRPQPWIVLPAKEEAFVPDPDRI